MNNSDFTKIMAELYLINARLQGAPQQVELGLLQMVDMIELFLTELDPEKKYLSDQVMAKTDLTLSRAHCKGASQVSALALNCLCTYLKLLIRLLDKEEAYTGKCNASLASMQLQNALCQSAPQQMQVRSHCVFELTQLLVLLLKPGEASELLLEGYKLLAEKTASLQQGAAQATAVYMQYTALQIKEIVQMHIGKDETRKQKLTNITSEMEANNRMCKGADQQSCNYLYRMLEMLTVLGASMIEKKEARVQAYWTDHPERKKSLEDEKAALQAEIEEIRAAADRVNENEAISRCESDIRQLKEERQQVGRDELADSHEKIAKARLDLNSLSFFKFRAKKELQERLAQLESEHQALDTSFFPQRKALGDRIEAAEKEISRLKENVKAEKERILADAEERTKRIEAIDRILNDSPMDTPKVQLLKKTD